MAMLKKTKKTGRRKAVINPNLVYQCALNGLTRQRIAIKCGVSKTTFHNHLSTNEKLRNAYEKGTADFIALVEKCLGEKALDGDVSAMKFILQTRDKDTYSLRNELTGADGGEIQIAARPMTVAERKKSVKEIREAIEADY